MNFIQWLKAIPEFLLKHWTGVVVVISCMAYSITKFTKFVIVQIKKIKFKKKKK